MEKNLVGYNPCVACLNFKYLCLWEVGGEQVHPFGNDGPKGEAER